MSAAFSEFTSRIQKFTSWDTSNLPAAEQDRAVELATRMFSIITIYKQYEDWLGERAYQFAADELEEVISEMEAIQEKANRLFEKARLN